MLTVHVGEMSPWLTQTPSLHFLKIQLTFLSYRTVTVCTVTRKQCRILSFSRKVLFLITFNCSIPITVYHTLFMTVFLPFEEAFYALNT